MNMNISRYNLKRFNKIPIILPSGNYTAVLETIRNTVVRDNQDILQLIWTITSGKHSDEFFHSYFNMSNHDSLIVFYKMLENMGLTPEKIKNTSEIYGNECHLIIERFNHKIYGPSNRVEKYLPVLNKIKDEMMAYA